MAILQMELKVKNIVLVSCALIHSPFHVAFLLDIGHSSKQTDSDDHDTFLTMSED